MIEDKQNTTFPPRGQAYRVCPCQSQTGAETAYPVAGQRVRHDCQQLHTGKGFQLQVESEADSKVGGRHRRYRQAVTAELPMTCLGKTQGRGWGMGAPLRP
jgi:hypothetical protein